MDVTGLYWKKLQHEASSVAKKSHKLEIKTGYFLVFIKFKSGDLLILKLQLLVMRSRTEAKVLLLTCRTTTKDLNWIFWLQL